jgi:uncharacterized protein
MKKNPVVHFEMPYDDSKRLSKFYGDAFGWELRNMGEKMGNYVLATTTETDSNMMVQTPGTINGGFAPRSEEYKQPSVVIDVDDITESIEKVKKAGGAVHGELIEIQGVGKYVWFTDTEGNRVSMLQPSSRD